MSRRTAQFAFGLTTRPDAIASLATDAIETVQRFEVRIGLIEIEPVPGWVFDCAGDHTFSQIVVQAFRGGNVDGMDEDGLRRIVERAVFRMSAHLRVEQGFREAAELLQEPYSAIARLAAHAAERRPKLVRADHEAPEGWLPPEDIDKHPRKACTAPTFRG